MVTGYEQDAPGFWSVDRCADEICQPVYVAGLYQGPNRENYHYFWRCRERGRGDLRITRVSHRAQRAPSNRNDVRWENVGDGDVLAPGTYLRIGPHSEVHWQRDGPSQSNGIIKAEDDERVFRIEAMDLAPVEPLRPAPASTDLETSGNQPSG